MATPLSPSSSRRNFNVNSSNRPSWLLSTLSDLEERMKILAINPTNGDHHQRQEEEGDTFAERAESYYQKRPQLLALLQDLYNSYVTLSDRYMQANSKNALALKRHVSQSSVSPNDTDAESDVESSLSYQQPQEQPPQDASDYDAVVAELVAKSVELEAATEEVAAWERRFGESARKAELQRSLLEVLESERVVLLNENARLEYRAAALADENEGLAAEAHFMRRRAAEMARLAVARLAEEQRVCILSRRIEDLQGQIYGLEKRNKDYFDTQKSLNNNNNSSFSVCSSSSSGCSSASLRNEAEKEKLKKEKNRNEVVFEGCFKMTRKIKIGMIKKKSGLGSFWERVKSVDLFFCGFKSS